MRILASGLDDTTVAFAQRGGISIERPDDLSDIEDVISWAGSGMFDCFVYDIEKNGLGLYSVRELRESRISIPVIGVSNNRDSMAWSETRSTFLENGGDDFLHAPCNPRELVASIRAVSRRMLGAQLDIIKVSADDHEFKANFTTGRVYLNGAQLDLTVTEFKFLVRFMQSKGRILTRDQLMRVAYDSNVHVDDRTIDSHIKRLRKKIRSVNEDAAAMLETRYGMGYVFAEGTA